MPWMQLMGTQASVSGSEENVGGTRRRVEEQYGAIGDPPVFSEFLGVILDRALSDDEAAYVNEMPDAVKESIRAAISDALRRNVPFFVQWTPAYDYQVSVWEAGAAATTGGLIMQVSGPYPSAPKR